MSCKGMASQCPNAIIAISPRSQNATQARSIQPAAVCGQGGSGSQSVSRTAHRLDQAKSELRAKPSHTNIDDVRAGVKVDSPDGGQQLLLGYGPPRVLHQFSEQQNFKAGQRHRADAAIGLQPPEVQDEVACLDDLMQSGIVA